MLTLLSWRAALAALGAIVLATLLAQAPSGIALAAADVYILPAGTTVPKDLFVVANEVVIEGEVLGNLAVISRRALITGAVRGDANIAAARIEIRGARLGVVRTVGAAETTPSGANLGAAGVVPVRLTPTAPATQEEQPRVPADRPDLREGLLALTGFAAVSAILLAIAPQALARPAAAIAERPWRTALIGLLTGLHFLVIPLGTLLAALLVGYFWDWFPAVLLTVMVFAAFGLLWFLSPLVTGVWVGRRLNQALGRAPLSRPVLVLGVVLLALLGQLPGVGWIVYLSSFVLAAGAIATVGAVSAVQPLEAPSTTPPPVATNLPTTPGPGTPQAS